MDLGAEMIEKGELARLVGRLEHQRLEPEGAREAIRQRAVQAPLLVEQPDAAGALPSLDDQLAGPGVEPPLPPLDQLRHPLARERPTVLLAQLELHLETARVNHAGDVARTEPHVGEALSRLDPRDADVGAEVEVRRERALR